MQARTIVDDKNKSYNNEMYMLCMHSTVAVIEMLRRSAMNKKEMHECMTVGLRKSTTEHHDKISSA